MPVNTDFIRLDNYISMHFDSQEKSAHKIIPIIKDFLANKGKRIRSALLFLFVRALNKIPDEFCIKNAMSVEFIHNASLIHDDIIDCSLLRRGKKTINFNYDSKLAVLAGDYLLAEVMKILSSIEDEKIRKVYSDSISNLLLGELNQYFNRFKICNIEQYIEKSRNKTARLFEAGIISSYIHISGENENIKAAENFAKNFGIAFQIINDLQCFENPDKVNEDIQNGDFSAPLIYYVNEKYKGKYDEAANKLPSIAANLKKSDAFSKTRELAKYYLDLAIENTFFLEDNQYKQSIIDLCNLYAST